jgi:putative peptide zinc metalloprotease protein
MLAGPKLRGDLVIRPQASGNGTTVVVKDPAARRFFRFGEVEHFVAQQLDGATPLGVVRDRVEERFGQPLPEQTLRHFVEQFRRFHLLDDGTERREDEHAHQRVRGSLLYIRVRAFDPDQFLDWLVTRMNVVFTRAFLLASAAAILIALAVTAVGWPQFTRDLTRLYRFDALLLAWVTMLSVTTAHELAHGVTCKRFGGQVNEIGFMLLYFQPAFYCNVSDAWLIPEKSKRLWVTFAGAYSEMLVWALATVAWRVTETDTWINFVALVIMATSGVKTLFNLNPLIKLDGYYLLSDYLEIPNLRQKSLAALKARARGLWNLSPDALRVHGREQRIYLGYGALAALCSTGLITLIAWRFGTVLTTRYGGVGFIAFAALLLTAFHRPLGNVLSKVKQPVGGAAAARRGPTGARRLALLAIVLAVIAMMPAELKVSGGFRILPASKGEIRAQIDGILTEIYKEEGDQIEPGDAIAHLDDREYQSELQKVNAQIVQAQARREMLRAGPRREEIELARSELDNASLRRQHGDNMFEDAARFRDAQIAKVTTAVEKAAQRLQFARNDLDRIQRLSASGLVARSSVEEAEHEVAVRESELEEARSSTKMALADDSPDARKERDLAAQEFSRAEGRLRVLMAGSRPEEVKVADAEIARLQAERAFLEQQLQLARVLSPSAGVIVTPKLKERRGERVSRGDLIANVYDQSTVTAEIMISEKEIGDVHVGQTVLVKARAFPDTTFTSRITAVAPVAVEDPRGLGGRMIRVMTDIDNRSHLLKPEMTGSAKIYCGTRRVFELAMRRIARYVRVEFWSWW